jgi:hypothetical protein
LSFSGAAKKAGRKFESREKIENLSDTAASSFDKKFRDGFELILFDKVSWKTDPVEGNKK